MNYLEIMTKAFAVRASPARPIGCCRVYISFDKDHAKGVAVAAKTLGKIFQKKGNMVSNVLYVGYDNCSGIELGKADAMISCFKVHGINCYLEYQGD